MAKLQLLNASREFAGHAGGATRSLCKAESRPKQMSADKHGRITRLEEGGRRSIGTQASRSLVFVRVHSLGPDSAWKTLSPRRRGRPLRKKIISFPDIE